MTNEREPHDQPTTGITAGGDGPHASRPSPLGALYRKEARRLRRRYPGLDDDRRDWIITLSFARAFLDIDADELEHAIREGSTRLARGTAGDLEVYVSRLVQAALATAHHSDMLQERL